MMEQDKTPSPFNNLMDKWINKETNNKGDWNKYGDWNTPQEAPEDLLLNELENITGSDREELMKRLQDVRDALANCEKVFSEEHDPKEFIVCSAIRTTPQGKEFFNGAEFLTGLRHHDIFRTFNFPPDRFFADRNPKAQGFMTSTGRFVGRKEAAEIARRRGQVREDHGGLLYSEDLY